MTKREITSLLLKLVGIFGLFSVVPTLVFLIPLLTTIHGQDDIWLSLRTIGVWFLTPLIWITVCIFIIRNSNNIAKRLYRQDSDASQLSALDFKECQTLGYTRALAFDASDFADTIAAGDFQSKLKEYIAEQSNGKNLAERLRPESRS